MYLTVVTAVAWVGSEIWIFGYHGENGNIEVANGGLFLVVLGADGSVEFLGNTMSQPYPYTQQADGFCFGRGHWNWSQDWLPDYRHYSAHFIYQTERWEFYVPLWIPLLLLGIPTAVFWWRDQRYLVGHCQDCGYDLTGNVTGICSECGEAIESPDDLVGHCQGCGFDLTGNVTGICSECGEAIESPDEEDGP